MAKEEPDNAGASGGGHGRGKKTGKGADLSDLHEHLRTMRFGQTASKFYEISIKNRPATAAAAIAKAAGTAETVASAAKELVGCLGGADDLSDAQKCEELSASALALFTTAQIAAVDACFAVELIGAAEKKAGARRSGKKGSGGKGRGGKGGSGSGKAPSTP